MIQIVNEIIGLTCFLSCWSVFVMLVGIFAFITGLQLKYGIKGKTITERIEELIEAGVWYDDKISTN